MSHTLRRLRLALFIAFRIVRSRRSPTLSLVTVLSILAVAFGSCKLSLALGVTGGFQDAFEQRILGLYPHLVVHKRGTNFREYPEVLRRLRDTPGVVGATAATYDDMMISAGVQRSGCVVKGLELSSVNTVVDLTHLLRSGSVEALSEALRAHADGATVRLDDVVAGTWWTVVADPDGGVLPVREDTTPPDPGNGRVAVLNLTGRPGVATSLVPDDPDIPDVPQEDADADAGSGPAPARLRPDTHRPVSPKRGGVLTHLLHLGDAGDGSADGAERPDADTPSLAPLPVALGTPAPRALTEAIEVPAGRWRLEPGGAAVSVSEETLLTLVLLPGPDGGAPIVRALASPARVPIRDGMAMVRLLNAHEAAGDDAGLTLSRADGPLTEAPVAPGAASPFLPTVGRLPGVLLGSELARRLDAKVGTEVTLVTPLRGVDNKMMGPYGMAPSSQRHVVVGTFESGFYEYDVRLALTSLSAAQRFMNRGKVVRWVEVRASDLMDLDELKRRVAAALDPYDMRTVVDNATLLDQKLKRILSGEVTQAPLAPARGAVGALRNAVKVLNILKYQEYDLGYQPRYRIVDWREMNKNLFSALKLQKLVLTMFFLIIIIVGSFVVVGSQIMVVHDKTPDIAILKAMGVTPWMIRLIFSIQALFVAGLGALLGVLSGAGLALLAKAVDYRLDAAVYLIDRLPVDVRPTELALVALGTVVTVFIATQYSAARAAHKNPVDGLRALD